MIVEDVISAVRRRLGDDRKERWQDEALILYTSLCQNDICIFTNYHRRFYNMPLYDSQLVYNLPTDCIRVERLEYECKFFPVESRNSIDRGAAEYPCALKDNLQYGQIEIHMEEACDVLSNELKDSYGVTTQVTDSHCTLADSFGVVSSVDDIFNPNPGAAEPEEVIGYIKVYYSAVPPIVKGVDDTLVVPDMWISAFIHYVCGMALQDDNDANNIQRGEMEAQKYVRLLSQLFKTSAKDFTTNIKSKLITPRRI